MRGSPQRPHFTGKSYIRDGPQTKEASNEQFESLIAQRSSKVYEILKWKGKEVTAERIHRNTPMHVDPSLGRLELTIEDCNQVWLILRTATGQLVAHSLALVDLSFDTPNDRLMLVLWRT